jgi:hypothetical protein
MEHNVRPRRLQTASSWNNKLSLSSFGDASQDNFAGWDTLQDKLPALYLFLPTTNDNNRDYQQYHNIKVWIDNNAEDFFYCECNEQTDTGWYPLFIFRSVGDLLMVKAKKGGYITTLSHFTVSQARRNFSCLSEIEKY